MNIAVATLPIYALDVSVSPVRARRIYREGLVLTSCFLETSFSPSSRHTHATIWQKPMITGLHIIILRWSARVIWHLTLATEAEAHSLATSKAINEHETAEAADDVNGAAHG